MKNIFTIILLTAIINVNAQVIIGDAAGTAATKTSVLLEFAAGNKGIIVPYVRTLPSATASTAGTILLDASTATTARVKFSNGTNWVDLSGQDANVAAALATQPTGVTETGAKSIIGAASSAADGVLVLESTTKAMVLPTVADVQNIPNPSPGMMVYVNKAEGKRLAVYNGSKWSFWKEPVSVVPTVTSATGKIWMDRDLGATQVATGSADPLAYGDLYQWGRVADGHQKKNSALTNVRSSTDVPGNDKFITDAADWRITPNNNLWQGVNGINNPCPSGFRIPTRDEFAAELALLGTANTATAFASVLKLPAAGYRNYSPGALSSVGSAGLYWTSTVSGSSTYYFYINTSAAGTVTADRAFGFSVRCIKDY